MWDFEHQKGASEMNLICKCGNEQFHVSTDGDFAMCGKCGKIYGKNGDEQEFIRPHCTITLNVGRGEEDIKNGL